MFKSSSFKCAALALSVAGAPAPVHAFCEFHVFDADAELEATKVVLMREGVRTVLSMQNHYKGPLEDFAMVVPVPVVLSEDDVKVLDDEIFARVDYFAAPRLVEYWEVDPCGEPCRDPCGGVEPQGTWEDIPAPSVSTESGVPDGAIDRSVVIEAQFVVGEYDIVILSANDSRGLDAWLRENGYAIPEGAEPVLRSYVEAGMKFFVAKVDVSKVRFVDGQAELSPLRFHYDSDAFSLPVRLGLLNSDGTQDLVVYILAPGQRYEMANYENVTVPTNLDVVNEVRNRFGEFYAALFDATLERHPRAIVTEYAWQAVRYAWDETAAFDVHPAPVLNGGDLMALGGDVLLWRYGPLVLTRLHTRYDRDALDEDLVFRAASPITGGREFDDSNPCASPARANNFQGRYAIRHEWEGPIECLAPVRGRWGGPLAGAQLVGERPASDLAVAPRGALQLASVVPGGIEALGIAGTPAAGAAPGDGCGTWAGWGPRSFGILGLLLFVGCVVVARRWRR